LEELDTVSDSELLGQCGNLTSDQLT